MDATSDRDLVRLAALRTRAGDTAGALELLAAVRDEAVRTEALDLEARIHAQQGRLDEAERAWQQVLEADPEHEGAKAGLDRVRAIKKAGGGLRRRGSLVLAAAVMIAMVVFGGLLFGAGFMLGRACIAEHVAALCQAIDAARGELAAADAALGARAAKSDAAVQAQVKRVRQDIRELVAADAALGARAAESDAAVQAQVERVRWDICELLRLDQTIRQLGERYQRLVDKGWFVSKEERAKARDEVARLQVQIQAILDRFATPDAGSASADAGQPSASAAD